MIEQHPSPAFPDRQPACAIVLAGGSSSRLGFDKRTLRVGGVPMVEHLLGIMRGSFSQVIVSSDTETRFARLDAEVVADRVTGAGPLMALASCLPHSRFELNFVVACDVPRPPMEVVGALLEGARDRDGAVPVTRGGFLEPLFAVYRRSSLPRVEALLEAGVHRPLPLIEGSDFARVPLAAFGFDEIPNINTREDLARFESLL